MLFGRSLKRLLQQAQADSLVLKQLPIKTLKFQARNIPSHPIFPNLVLIEVSRVSTISLGLL